MKWIYFCKAFAQELKITECSVFYTCSTTYAQYKST